MLVIPGSLAARPTFCLLLIYFRLSVLLVFLCVCFYYIPGDNNFVCLSCQCIHCVRYNYKHALRNSHVLESTYYELQFHEGLYVGNCYGIWSTATSQEESSVITIDNLLEIEVILLLLRSL